MKKEAVTPPRVATDRLAALPHRVPAIVGACLIVLGMTACNETAAKTQSAGQQQSSSKADSGGSDLLATVGDQKITMSDVKALAGEDLDKLEIQYRLTKSRIVNNALDSLLRAQTIGEETKKTGKSVADLVAAESAVPLDPSDVEVATWYKENSDKTGGRSLDQLRAQIADYLRTQRRTAAEKKLEDRLRAERKVAITYQPYRLQFANDGAPTKGKADAPITLVEFSDFQCPFCQRMAPTLKEVEKKFGDQVRIVYRQYPIVSLHPNAFKAAEASLCANEQGKFWDMHDAMFSNQNKLNVSDLKATAQQLGMDVKKFNGCLDSGRYVEQIQNDSKEAVRAGVTGTPAIFINGIGVDGGAVPMNVLERAIQKELSRSKISH